MSAYSKVQTRRSLPKTLTTKVLSDMFTACFAGSEVFINQIKSPLVMDNHFKRVLDIIVEINYPPEDAIEIQIDNISNFLIRTLVENRLGIDSFIKLDGFNVLLDEKIYNKTNFKRLFEIVITASKRCSHDKWIEFIHLLRPPSSSYDDLIFLKDYFIYHVTPFLKDQRCLQYFLAQPDCDIISYTTQRFIDVRNTKSIKCYFEEESMENDKRTRFSFIVFISTLFEQACSGVDLTSEQVLKNVTKIFSLMKCDINVFFKACLFYLEYFEEGDDDNSASRFLGLIYHIVGVLYFLYYPEKVIRTRLSSEYPPKFARLLFNNITGKRMVVGGKNRHDFMTHALLCLTVLIRVDKRCILSPDLPQWFW